MKGPVDISHDEYLVDTFGSSINSSSIDELEWGYLKQHLLWYRFRTNPRRIETTKQQRFKKMLLELVFQAARLNVPILTFPVVESIVYGFDASSTTSDRTQMVLNLKRASDYIFETDDHGLELLRGINFFVSENESEAWSVLRNLSDRSKLESMLDKELTSADDAIRLILSLLEAEPFFGGNLRTAYLYVSKVWFELSGEVLKLNPDSFKQICNAYIEGRVAIEGVYYSHLRS